MDPQHGALPLLSVTVLNYNYGRYLPRCLDSILRQDFTDFEIILINDRSTDNSLEVIAPYLADPRVRLVDHQENKGFVASLIEGVELSRAACVTVVSADDWILRPDAFSQQMAMMQSDAELAFVYTAYGHFEVEGRCDHIWRAGQEQGVRDGREAFQDLVLNPFLLHSGTIIRRACYDQVGGYDASFRYSVDTKMWLGLCRFGKVGYINEVMYAYRRHGKNMSKSTESLRRAIQEIVRAIHWAFDQMRDELGQSWQQQRNTAEARGLVAFAIDDIFRSHYSAGWYTFYVAFRINPLRTLMQKSTPLLALRTLLGRDGYHSLRTLILLFNLKRRERNVAEEEDTILRQHIARLS